MRVILCPHEIGRNTRKDNEATRRSSSLTEVHPFCEWEAHVIHTRAHTLTIATGGDSGRFFCTATEKEKRARAAREKRVRKKMIG
ncbi:hypothetical protein ALC53_04916 [Atta colombica]|uniref:Uncharacterized protein n=1 Tax=Atta colombica TaxID=520822 RepID=A0A195BKF5_9HYME|nr:hypothetical protein ALC53_04916 [Atta colombica]